MSLNDITSEAVATVLQALRSAAPPPPSPLLQLAAVSRLLQGSGIPDASAARFQLLGEVLTRVVWEELARLRPATEHVVHPTEVPEPLALTLLRADFNSGNDDRAAWGALYFQYLSISRVALTDLDRHDIPYYTFRRRRRRGCRLLAARLRQLEVRDASTSTLPRGAGPLPAAGQSIDNRQSDAVEANAAGHVDSSVLATPSRDGQRPKHWIARPNLLVGLLVLAILAVAAAGRLRSPVVSPGLASPTSPNKIAVIGPVAVSPARPRAGDTVTVSFQVRNSDSRPHTLAHLRAGGRGPRACAHVWSSPNVDFPDVANLHLSPGELFTYRASRVLSTPGDYFVEPVQVGASGRWGGMGPSPRAWIGVTDPATGVVPAPDCLLLVSGPDLQPPSPRVGAAFTVTLSIRNNSNDVLRLQKLMVGVRDPAAAQLAWRTPTVFMPTERDLTLEPGETYLYRKSRIARETEAGRHLIAPAVQQDGNWTGVWPFESRWVTILPE